MTRLLIHVLYHDETSKVMAELIEKQAPYLVPRKLEAHPLFESQFYLARFTSEEWADYDYVGTIAYNYHEKMGISVSSIPASISSALRRGSTVDADVIFLNNSRNSAISIAHEGSAGHGPAFRQCWISLLARLGYNVEDTLDERHPVCWNNYWIAKPQAMREYCRFVKRAWHVLLIDSDLVTLFDSDSQWKSHLDEEQLMHIFRKPYYAMYPFVFERLPGFFFNAAGKRLALNHDDTASSTPMTDPIGDATRTFYAISVVFVLMLVTAVTLVVMGTSRFIRSSKPIY